MDLVTSRNLQAHAVFPVLSGGASIQPYGLHFQLVPNLCGLKLVSFWQEILPVSKKNGSGRLKEKTPGAFGLQKTALAKQHSHDLRVNESETCGLNFPLNMPGLKYSKGKCWGKHILHFPEPQRLEK